MNTPNNPDSIADASGAEDEMQLRKRLFELDSAMDQLRKDVGAAAELAELATERDEIRARLQALDPPDTELGYQRSDREFSKVQSDGRYIASPGETGGLA